MEKTFISLVDSYAKYGQWVEKPYACSFASKEEARKGMLASTGTTNGLIINKDTNEIIIRWEKK